ncbi:hypothetical protein AOLI_G00126310 [Acnodon oligacanthus]
MAHFKEKSDALILQVDATATPADVERWVSLPDSPRLIVQGETLTSVTWMISIEVSTWSTKKRPCACWNLSKDCGLVILAAVLHPVAAVAAVSEACFDPHCGENWRAVP